MMSAIRFLDIQEVLAIHTALVARYGGEDGVRDFRLLDAALGQPAAGMGGVYFHEDIFAMASAYLYHIAMNHPFVDGNKRTASIAALVFLELNGRRVCIDEPGLADLTIAVTKSEADKSVIAACFKKHAVKI